MENKIQKNANVNVLTKMRNKKIFVNVLTGRKSQLTMFMILGIIILFAFAFLYFGISTTTKSRVRTQVAEQAEDILSQRSVRYYTIRCIEGILIDGLILLGKQGGYIYRGQPGSIIPPGYIERSSDDITPYLVRPSQFLPPQYPCYTSVNPPVYCGFINNISLYPQLYSTVYGTNLIPYLQKYQGSYSIQEQLESYVSAEATRCLPNLTGVPEFSNYQINPGDIRSEIEFTEATIKVEVDYPVVIDLPNIEPVSTTLKISATAHIRFKQLYDSLKEAIQYDNNYLDYNIIDDTYAGNYLGRHLKFSVLEGVSFRPQQLGLTEDIFILNDTESMVEGRPFIFRFARKNRYPALDYIPGMSPPATLFDFVLYENDTLRVEPKASDPDEDMLSYSYHGWKAEYDSIWNDTTRNQIIITPLQTNNWEESSLFQTTSQLAEINLTHSDIGIHNFTVNVTDDSRLSDYQVVRVLVDAILRAEIKGENLYDDINNSFASIEDPYLLNVTSRTILVDPTTRYEYFWFDTTGPPPIHQGNLSCILLPNTQEQCFKTPPSIDNMVGRFSTPSPQPIPTPRVGLEIYAYGLNNQTASTIYNLTVYECLPHRSNSLPYPYHDAGDPFQADHTCCSDGTDDYEYGEIRRGEECLNVAEYTCWSPPGQSMGLAVQEATGNPPTLWPATVNIEIPADYEPNDIYRRTLRQLCGNRGNACSGRITDSAIGKFRDCKDKEPGEKETCAGPAKNSSCVIDQINPQCYPYDPGESLEKNFLGTGNGICNDDRKCSPINAWRGGDFAKGAYGDGGPLNCSAQCSGDGTCSYAYDCLCSSSCDSSVSSKCDDKPVGYSESVYSIWENPTDIDDIYGTKKEHGCDFNCQFIDCEPYVFNPAAKACITPGNAFGDNDCDDGFHNEGGYCVES